MKKIWIWLAGCALLVGLTGCSGLMKADMQMSAGHYQEAISLYEGYLAENPKEILGRSRLGYAYLRTGRLDDAQKAFEGVLKKIPGEPYTVLYLGLTYVNQGAFDKAVETWKGYHDKDRPLVEEAIGRQLTLLQIAESQRMAKRALADEARLQTVTPPANTIAVFDYQDMTPDRSLAAHRKALEAMIISDMSKVKALKVVERLRLQSLMDEMNLGQTGIVDAADAPRAGRLLGARNLMVGTLMKGSLKVTTSVNDQTAAVSVAEADFWQIPGWAVKTAVQALGLSLSADEGKAIGVPHTKNLKAFTYYGEALVAMDAGNWKAARNLFEKALKEDPKFVLAKEGAASVPDSTAPALGAITSLSASTVAEGMDSAIKAAEIAQVAANQAAAAKGEGGG